MSSLNSLDATICTDNMSLLRDYEARLVGEGKRGGTLKMYVGVAGWFLDSVEGKTDGLTKEHVLRFRDAMASRVKDYNSMMPYVCALNSFTRYLGREDFYLKPPKQRVKKIVPLSAEELVRMIKAAGENSDPYMARRDTALLFVLMEGAARNSEASGILMEDADLEHSTLWARKTKSGNDRPIYLTAMAVEAITAYLQVREPGATEEDDRHLFLSVRGRRFGDDAVRSIVKAAAARAGIRRRVWPHLLRHSKLTQLGEAGFNAYMIKDIAGHETLEMGARYVHMSSQVVRRAALSRPIITAEASGAAPRVQDVDTERAKRELALKLAIGQIDQDTFKTAMSVLGNYSSLEVLR